MSDSAAGTGFDNYIAMPHDASFLISDATESEFDSKHSPLNETWIDLFDSRILGCTQLLFKRADWTAEAVRNSISPMLEKMGAEFLDCAGFEDGPFSGNPWLWTVRFSLDTRGRTVHDVLLLAEAVRRLLMIVDGEGELDAATARDLLSAGHAIALYGQPESAWLEVKTFAWDLSNEAGKIELAQDVARFANGDEPGLMVIGLGTKKVEGVETVVKGPGQRFSAKDAQRFHHVVDQRVYPPVEGLVVLVETDGHGGNLLSFWIPAQPSELKPFLVHGTIVGSKVEGAFFSVVRRRGEHSIPATPQALHAQIAAGRALLRGGLQFPPALNVDASQARGMQSSPDAKSAD